MKGRLKCGLKLSQSYRDGCKDSEGEARRERANYRNYYRGYLSTGAHATILFFDPRHDRFNVVPTSLPGRLATPVTLDRVAGIYGHLFDGVVHNEAWTTFALKRGNGRGQICIFSQRSDASFQRREREEKGQFNLF